MQCAKKELIGVYGEKILVKYILNEDIAGKAINNEQVKKTQETRNDAVLRSSNTNFLVHDHSYTEELNNKQPLKLLKNKNNKERNDELSSCLMEEIINENADKIAVECDNLDENNFQMVGENEENLRNTEEIQKVPNKLQHKIWNNNCSKSKSYKCTVCRKTLDLGQSLKIHMVVHKEKKYVYCEDCFKQFAHKRSLLQHTSVQNLLSQKLILREDINARVLTKNQERTDNKITEDNRTGESELFPCVKEETVNLKGHKMIVKCEALVENTSQIQKTKKAIENTEKSEKETRKLKRGVSVSNAKDLPAKCTVCLQLLNLEQSSKVHMVVCNEEEYVCCEKCFKCFVSSGTLLGHTILYIHNNPILKKSVDACGRNSIPETKKG